MPENNGKVTPTDKGGNLMDDRTVLEKYLKTDEFKNTRLRAQFTKTDLLTSLRFYYKQKLLKRTEKLKRKTNTGNKYINEDNKTHNSALSHFKEIVEEVLG